MQLKGKQGARGTTLAVRKPREMNLKWAGGSRCRAPCSVLGGALTALRCSRPAVPFQERGPEVVVHFAEPRPSRLPRAEQRRFCPFQMVLLSSLSAPPVPFSGSGATTTTPAAAAVLNRSLFLNRWGRGAVLFGSGSFTLKKKKHKMSGIYFSGHTIQFNNFKN